VATHRRPADLETPAELLEFMAEEWESPGDSGWWPAFERWKGARRGWVAQHPGSVLGNLLALMVVVRDECGRRIGVRKGMGRRWLRIGGWLSFSPRSC
jgi:hypothetical protein